MVSEIDDIGTAINRFKHHDVPIVFGPGRHIASNSVFLYFLDPDGLTLEYSYGMEEFAGALAASAADAAAGAPVDRQLGRHSRSAHVSRRAGAAVHRRAWLVGEGCRVNSRAIDIHTHVVPHDLPPYAGASGESSWPSMVESSQCHHRSVMIDGKVFRSVSHECWDVEQRLIQMDATGIRHQVLSPMPELLSYWMSPSDALALCRYVNDVTAEMVARAPERFSALGAVPLQDPELAARELEALMATGHFSGVEIGTNVDGVVIGDARFEPFFATAERLGAAIFVHPLRPTRSRPAGRVGRRLCSSWRFRAKRRWPPHR